MDGPNVNWKFYTDLTKERNSEELLNIGSCGLHIVHGGLQKGVNESGWKLGHLMRSLWKLFHDTPARREDFVKLTGSTEFPLKFCPHRWVEECCGRVGSPNVAQHQEVCFVLPCTTQEGPADSLICTLSKKEACEDPLTVTKLEWRNNFSHFCSSSRQMPQWLLSWGSH